MSEMLILDDVEVEDRHDIHGRYVRHVARETLDPSVLRDEFAFEYYGIDKFHPLQMPEPGDAVVSRSVLDVDSGSEADSDSDSDSDEDIDIDDVPKRKKSVRIRTKFNKKPYVYPAAHRLEPTPNYALIPRDDDEDRKIREFNAKIIEDEASDEIVANSVLFEKPKFEIKSVYKIADFSNEFICEKQKEDTFCFAIQIFLENGNANLLNEFPTYLKRYVNSGRFILNSRTKLIEYRHQNSTRILVPSVLRHSL